MHTLPFNNAEEAKAYFGVNMPPLFLKQLSVIDQYCYTNQLDTADVLYDNFGMLRIEGDEARYRQTPIEFFPFSSIGCDGIHYGYIIHVEGEEDYPSGEICPMDDSGVILIGHNTEQLFQNLLTEDASFLTNEPLLRELQLAPMIIERQLYDKDENPVRININPKPGWRFIQTSDGAGVYAPEHLFDSYHQQNPPRPHRFTDEYRELANEMETKGLYASQLYYLKELFWAGWTNHELAKTLLAEMITVYEKLKRKHLSQMAKMVLVNFDRKYK